jgi:DNA-binding NarL/FixJ family response regulator
MGSQAPPDHRTRIILCDDTRDILLLLGAEFELHSDLEIVAEADNGRQVIALAESLQPDVIVLDLAMPEMDGLEALPELRRVAPKARIVVLSGFEARSLAPKVLALGAQRYLEKGTSASDIAGVIREVSLEAV